MNLLFRNKSTVKKIENLSLGTLMHEKTNAYRILPIGAPITNTSSPTLTLSLLPNFTALTVVFKGFQSNFIIATSACGEELITLAGTSSPEEKTTEK